jgi:hypothetical protein
MLIVEVHELHQELQKHGFTSKDANAIVGHILYDLMMDRPVVSEEDFDYNEELDLEDDNDEGDTLYDDPDGERPL